MGSARVVASMALLLAVGPLLLLAPWWPLPDYVVALLLFFTVVALLLLFFVAYRGSSTRQSGWTATAGPHRPRASWQAGRWDTDSRHAYVANVGEGIAYQVSVAVADQIIGTEQSVPPYRADRLGASSEPPFYVNFCIGDRLVRRISFGVDGPARGAQDKAVDREPFEVVQVSWSENGEQFSQTVRID